MPDPVQGLAYLKGRFPQNITVSIDAGGGGLLACSRIYALNHLGLVNTTTKKVSCLPLLHKKYQTKKINLNMG